MRSTYRVNASATSAVMASTSAVVARRSTGSVTGPTVVGDSGRLGGGVRAVVLGFRCGRLGVGLGLGFRVGGLKMGLKLGLKLGLVSGFLVGLMSGLVSGLMSGLMSESASAVAAGGAVVTGSVRAPCGCVGVVSSGWVSSCTAADSDSCSTSGALARRDDRKSLSCSAGSVDGVSDESADTVIVFVSAASDGAASAVCPPESRLVKPSRSAPGTPP